jgi:hypothetical protein
MFTSSCRGSSLFLWEDGQQALLCPEINEGLHRLDFLVANEVEQATDIDEVDEARVELLVGVDVPEGLQPVAVVDVGVAAHHLAVDALDIRLECLGETGRLAEPVTASELFWCSEGYGCGVGGEDVGVVDLADNPFLDEVDVLDGGDLDRLLVVVEPGVGVAAIVLEVVVAVEAHRTYPLADMVGQTSGLQMGLPVRSSMTLMTSIICSSRRYCSTTGHTVSIGRGRERGHEQDIPWWASHSPSSTSLGLAASVMKLPLTMRLEYSSRKKKGGLRDPEGAVPSAASKDMDDDMAGECGMGDMAEPWWEGDWGYWAVGGGVPLLPWR